MEVSGSIFGTEVRGWPGQGVEEVVVVEVVDRDLRMIQKFEL